MCDHYFAPLNPNAQDCIKNIQEEAFRLGISLKTRHREVAPNQYEMAPYFGRVTQQVDQNLVIMQLCEEIAARYNLACLFQEKPFADINGSGKHNNWSMGTTCGVNLLNAKQIEKATGSPVAFPLVLAAMVQAVDKHGDLMRAAIACPGNDFRLGACEAPPAVISAYLGKSVTDFLDDFRQGKVLFASLLASLVASLWKGTSAALYLLVPRVWLGVALRTCLEERLARLGIRSFRLARHSLLLEERRARHWLLSSLDTGEH